MMTVVLECYMKQLLSEVEYKFSEKISLIWFVELTKVSIKNNSKAVYIICVQRLVIEWRFLSRADFFSKRYLFLGRSNSSRLLKLQLSIVCIVRSDFKYATNSESTIYEWTNVLTSFSKLHPVINQGRQIITLLPPVNTEIMSGYVRLEWTRRLVQSVLRTDVVVVVATKQILAGKWVGPESSLHWYSKPWGSRELNILVVW